MVRRLLIAAAVVAAAAAVGEYKFVLGDTCGCGTPAAPTGGIQTYNMTTAAFCPTSSYPTCDITKMVEQDCAISCPHARASVVYRNNSVVFLSTSKISCIKGADGTSTLKNAEGETLYNLMRPTCAFKASCDQCSVAYQSTCPTGMTCKQSNLDAYTAGDSCERLGCKDNSVLKLYDTNGAQIAYNARELTNYSVDGSIVGGSLIDQPFTANCVLPKACEECAAPQFTKDVSQLPTPFRTAYAAGDFVHTKAAGSCSLFTCVTGYTLYGFSGTSNTVTGLEYTNKGFLKCNGNSQWTNGGGESTPSTFLVACLKTVPKCQTCTQNMLNVTTTSPLSFPMASDVTTMSEGCAQRTFTCKGAIEEFYSTDDSGSYGQTPPDPTTEISTVTLTCNDGAFWGNPYMVARVECRTPKCQSCAQNMIAVTTQNPLSIPMASDVTKMAGGCTTRQFTCRGGSIQLFTATTSYWMDADATGTSYLQVNCNADGTAWQNTQLKVVRVECVAPPTTIAPPTTPNPCGPYDPLVIDGPASFVCKDGQNRLECAAPTDKIEILTATESLHFDKMTFVPGKGWLTFDCTGKLKQWKNSADIIAVVCP